MATETIVSPGVLLQEVDKSFITPGTDPSGLAIIGPTARGPIEIPTLITNYNDFKEVYGTVIKSGSQGYEYFTNLAVKNYFDNGGASALVVRVVNDADNQWAYASSSKIEDSAANSAASFELESLGKGDLLNSIGPLYSGGGLHSGSKDNFRWEVSNVNSNAGTFTLSIRRGDDTTNAPIVLEQFTNCSLDPLSPNYISRKVGDQRLVKNSTDTDNVVIDVEGEFPSKSQFIRIKAVNSPTYQYLTSNGSIGTDSNGNLFSDFLPAAASGTFEGGTGNNVTDGTPLFGSEITSTNIQGLGTADYTDAISILKNKEEFKFKTLVTPGLNQENHSSTIDSIIANTTFRGDSLFGADMVPYNATQATVKTESEELDTNYAATYWPWAQVRSVE